MPTESPKKLVDHFFRHESGKLVSALVKFFGWQHFDVVEDMVQSALVEALQVWKIQGVPDNPAAWIYRVTRNRVIDELRRNTNFKNKARDLIADADPSVVYEVDEIFHESVLHDSQLRMMFACCNPELSAEAAIPFTLKILCGFSDEEIASGMLLAKETVRKRIYRAKQLMIDNNISLEIPPTQHLSDRLQSVHNVLYLMFNEGYASTKNGSAIRPDVCEEAARLCHMLVENKHCRTGATQALLALMLFHASRFDSRIDESGMLILLEEQDRRKWDRRMMARAAEFLEAAYKDKDISAYHLEAAIAMQHCKAASFEDTDWSAIVKIYDHLIDCSPAPVYKLNRAIAVGQLEGPDVALREIVAIKSTPQMQNFHLMSAAEGELYRMKRQFNQARECFENALALATAEHDKQHLKRRIDQCRLAGEVE